MAVTLHAHTMSAVLSGNRGAVGVGIADITFNDDYTMTITLTDGSTYTSGNLRGAQGIPGIDAEYDGEELVITEGNDTISDGGEVSTIRVKGEARTIRDRVTEEMACSAYPTETVTGEIVSITDGAEDIPVKALTVAVEPKQAGSGDPSPDNIRAITGWDAVNVVRCGKNLIDMKGLNHTSGTVTAMTFLKKGTYYVYQFSGSSAHNTSFYYSLDGTNKTIIPTTDDGYAVAALSSASYNRQKNMITLHQDCYFALSILGNASIGENPIDVMVTTDGTGYDSFPNNAGSLAYKDSMYEPYNATTYPIPLPSTVYGGTLDVASGVMTVDRKYVTAKLSDMSKRTDGTVTNRYTLTNAFSDGEVYSLSSGSGKTICNMVGTYAYNTGDTVHYYLTATNVILFLPKDTDETLEMQIVATLTTPQTITLDPTTISTLLGNNTLYADAGQVSVCYRADVGLYIDGKITAVMAAIAELS